MLKTKEFKAALKFIATKDQAKARPALSNVFINPQEGYIAATNSHILVRINVDIPDKNNGMNYLMDKNGNTDSPERYPSLTNLMKTYDSPAAVMHIQDINEWIDAHNLMLPIADAVNDSPNTTRKDPKSNRPSVTTLNNNVISSSVEWLGSAKHTFDETMKGDPISISYNPHYMLTVLKAFKDLKQKNVTIQFRGPVSLMIFQSEDVLALVLPIRLPTGGK